jgi:hypothetical protein
MTETFEPFNYQIPMVEHLLAKARSYPEKEAAALIAARNYQDLDQLVLEHLMGVR